MPLAFLTEMYNSFPVEQKDMQRHSLISVLLAVLGGFSLSFIVLSLILLFPLDALLLGDVLQDAPFNLAMHNQMLATATLQLASFWFWAFVGALGIFFSWWLLKVFR